MIVLLVELESAGHEFLHDIPARIEQLLNAQGNITLLLRSQLKRTVAGVGNTVGEPEDLPLLAVDEL